ncbi:MAG TPA: sodium:solute symporter [Vicinamibacteria bacterium]|nr:sodium:solute symporter [Vicinamibacteria bacterium]
MPTRLAALDVAVLIFYLALMLYLGVRGWSMSQSSSGYLVAGRSLGYGMYVACLSAVVLGGASTVGGTRLGFEYGLSGMWMVFMMGAGVMALGLFLTNRVSKLRVLSISEMLELRYDEKARLVSAVIMAIYAALIAVVQVIAIGTLLTAILGWSFAAGMFLGGAVVLFYTFLGGMWSVSMTDSVQWVLMTVGIFFLAVPMGLARVGGWGALARELPPTFFRLDAIGYDEILSFFLLFCLGLAIGQDIWQRVFTARDPTVARRGTILAGAYCAAYAVATSVIGMIAAVAFPELEDSQMAYATVVVELLPPGVTGIVLAGTLSALMSTASGTLLASSTLIAHDVYRRFLVKDVSDEEFLRKTRLVTGVLGILLVAIALWIQDVIVALDIAYTLLSGSLFFPIIAGMVWKRATAPATLVSMGLSALASSLAMVAWGAGSTRSILVGLGTSLVTLVAVSYWRGLAFQKNGGGIRVSRERNGP